MLQQKAVQVQSKQRVNRPYVSQQKAVQLQNKEAIYVTAYTLQVQSKQSAGHMYNSKKVHNLNITRGKNRSYVLQQKTE